MKKIIIFFTILLFFTNSAISAKDIVEKTKTKISSNKFEWKTLSDEELIKTEKAVFNGEYQDTKKLVAHYKLKNRPELSYLWLNFGVENNDMWSLCEKYVSYKEKQPYTESLKLLKKINELKTEQEVPKEYFTEVLETED